MNTRDVDGHVANPFISQYPQSADGRGDPFISPTESATSSPGQPHTDGPWPVGQSIPLVWGLSVVGVVVELRPIGLDSPTGVVHLWWVARNNLNRIQPRPFRPKCPIIYKVGSHRSITDMDATCSQLHAAIDDGL